MLLWKFSNWTNWKRNAVRIPWTWTEVIVQWLLLISEGNYVKRAQRVSVTDSSERNRKPLQHRCIRSLCAASRMQGLFKYLRCALCLNQGASLRLSFCELVNRRQQSARCRYLKTCSYLGDIVCKTLSVDKQFTDLLRSNVWAKSHDDCWAVLLCT